MRLASFNVENLFARAKVLNTATWEQGRPQLAAFERFNRTAQRRFYRKVDKDKMLQDLETLAVITRASSDDRLIRQPNQAAQLAVLRENRGDFMVERQATGVEIVAAGRADWIGWLELVVEPVDEVAIRMTARVIQDLEAGVLAVVEAENRPSLVRFNESMLANRYRHVMLVDGNDQRGIDVGLFTTASRPIVRVESHVDDRDTTNPDPTKRDNRLFSPRRSGVHRSLQEREPPRHRQPSQVAVADRRRAARRAAHAPVRPPRGDLPAGAPRRREVRRSGR